MKIPPSSLVLADQIFCWEDRHSSTELFTSAQGAGQLLPWIYNRGQDLASQMKQGCSQPHLKVAGLLKEKHIHFRKPPIELESTPGLQGTCASKKTFLHQTSL